MSTANLNGSLDAAITVFKNLDSLPKLPYCTGTFPWDKDKYTLFYKGESRFLNFPATHSQLESLFNACSEGKFDPGDFGMSFSPCDEGLVGIPEDGLLQDIGPKNIKVELSRLDVYGPGESSNAAHLDAPSSMIASLVVILPSVHEGGSLVLCQDGKEWIFDSSKAVSTTPNAQAAFIASYRDVKHKVKEVTSGYLVTLTYNLYLKKAGKTSLALTSSSEQENTELELKEALDSLLKDSAFFPDGGIIGFGLSHKYPFVVESTNLLDIKEGLKGSDATIKPACESLELGVSVKAVCLDEDAPGRAMLIDDPTNFNYQVESLIEHLADYGALAVAEHKRDGSLKSNCGDEPIAWLRPLDNTNGFTFYYILQDYKRPCMIDVNAEVCLVARIPPAQERGQTKKRRLSII